MIKANYAVLACALLLGACTSERKGPADAKEIQAAVQRAEQELVAAQAKGQSGRKVAEAYASLPSF